MAKFEIFVMQGEAKIKLATLDSDIQATQLALAVHQSSNEPHIVSAVDEKGNTIVSLFIEPKNESN